MNSLVKDIDRVRTNVLAIKSKLGEKIKAFAACEDPDELMAAQENVPILRKWAEVHKLADEIRLDLLIMELTCLTRLIEIGWEEGIPKRLRKISRWAHKNPEEVDAVLKDSDGVITLSGLYRRWQHLQHEESEANYAVAVLNGEKQLSLRPANAAKLVLDHYLDEGEPFTVSEAVVQLAEEYPDVERLLHNNSSFRKVMAEGIRAAIRHTASVDVDGICLPRVLVVHTSTHGVVRVPIESATVEQFGEQITQRERQLEEDVSALVRLKTAYRALIDKGLGLDDLIGSILGENIAS